MKLSSTYNPAEHESNIYELWEQNNAFVPTNRYGNQETYSIIVPPPNANGNLHIGHALTFDLQDIAIRYQRMQGKATLFLPGADHAGFETQVVYERELAKQGKSRFDFSREEIYDQIWAFVDKNKTTYQSQFRRLGASVDWNYFTFTLDDKVINRANQTFKKLWDEGLIYRGERLVNFCTLHGTAFADIEVEYKDEAGHLWEINYPLTDNSGNITIATTRPETLLGDTAVAVNPKDKKMVKYIGKTVKLPLTNRQIPIIADEMVDISFGTGAVKITPAHDPNDFDAGERHDLPKISVIGADGLMTAEAGEEYRGLSVEQARKKVIKELEQLKLLNKTTPYNHSVGHCYKCGTVIQPLLRDQWFISTKPLASKAIKVLKANKIKFYPKTKLNQLIAYLEGLKDWNISRQIAWGIPIPAFVNVDEPNDWIFDTRTDQEILQIDGKTYSRDPDVFDTWFSSGQWPFVTLDYPDSKAFEQFYPLSVMETGVDILAPWVSRMLMLGLHVTGEIPFESVYLHGMVLDEHGAKMSKSKGNVVNPMDTIDQFGSDALRMGIVTGQSAGNNQPFTPAKVIGARNFCNKLWNIARYVKNTEDALLRNNPNPETIADHWVLKTLSDASKRIAKLLEQYRFSEGFEVLYHTIWDEVADWYIEASKSGTGQGMLRFVLETTLKIAHPFAPFVTEAIWQELIVDKNTTINLEDLLIVQKWPEALRFDKAKAAEFEKIRQTVTEVRQLTAKLKLSRPTLTLEKQNTLTDNSNLVCKLANLSVLKQGSGHGLSLLSTKGWLEVDDNHLKDYKKALMAKITAEQGSIANLNKRLSNKAYVAQAPEQVVQQTKDQLKQALANLELLQKDQKRFK